MKSFYLNNVFDQKKIKAHVIIFLFSLIMVISTSLFKDRSAFPEYQINLFILLMVQIELFIFIGGRVFGRLELGSTRKELTRKVLSGYLLFIGICFVCALVIIIIFMIVTALVNGSEPLNALSAFFKNGVWLWFRATTGGLLFGAAIFIFMQWQEALSREQKLREENLIFQNETLKNQVNPHFLFNSLNTLSSLIETSPVTADKFVQRLSSIYRYILENISKDRVPLEAELAFISDYFYLHKIRDNDKIELEINVREPEKYEILPVSLQILVENAIKHNKATREESLKISIYDEGHQIVVKNNLQKMATQVKSTGIGLKNLSERVKLVSGMNLEKVETDSYFLVKLPLL